MYVRDTESRYSERRPAMSTKATSLSLVGAWLANTVGIGNTFTKQSLREALPQYEQVDRRMRDLRNYGWRIDTNREDAELRPNELKLVQIGEPVWSDSFVATTRTGHALSVRERNEVLANSGFSCARCGIGVGEQYEEFPGRFARLTARVSGDRWFAMCDVCGSAPFVAERNSAMARLVKDLTDFEFEAFRSEPASATDPLARVRRAAKRMDFADLQAILDAEQTARQ